MRAYFFGNMYLSSIQQGIQAAHCTAELFMKYPANIFDQSGVSVEDEKTASYLHDWAQDHKTMVLLNGGDSDALFDLSTFMEVGGNPYPWAEFEEEGVNDAITCVGIILPEKIYSDQTRYYVRSETRREPMARIQYNFPTPDLTPWEYQLVQKMNECGLAR